MDGMSALRTLPELFQAVGLKRPEGMDSIPLRGLRLDSRQVQEGDCFLALRGSKLDGISYAAEAAGRGAAAVVTEARPGVMKGSVKIPVIVAPVAP